MIDAMIKRSSSADLKLGRSNVISAMKHGEALNAARTCGYSKKTFARPGKTPDVG